MLEFQSICSAKQIFPTPKSVYNLIILIKIKYDEHSSNITHHIEVRVETLSATMNKFYLLPLQFQPVPSLLETIVNLSPLVQSLLLNDCLVK